MSTRGSSTTPPSERTAVRRLPERGSYDADRAYAILDEGFVAHVGLAGDHGPVVIPMLYARDGDRLLLHGSPASRLLRTAANGVDVCVTVTLIDGLVLARSAFHHSVNYRSVVVFGRAERIQDLVERRAALDVLVEAIVPGRSTEARPPNDKELRGTQVLALPLDELSVKVRTGGPVDEPEDYDLDVWAGVLPLPVVPGPPLADEVQPADRSVPDYIAAYDRRPAAEPSPGG
jgi:nitroimidazol reductase NimA-like FMN-containing flavoprotein (pyridoxamine 5'-phosphate oxidase superfamily)